MWKTELLPKYTSLRRSSQALRCHANINQALKEAMNQASKQDIKQASEYALIRHSSTSRLSSGLCTAITAM